MQWEQVLRVTGVQAGSGYLIAPRLVLTSAHVVGDSGTAVRLFRPGAPGAYSGTVVWCGHPGGRDDAALVDLTDPAWEPPSMRAVVWGRAVTHQPKIACKTWGVPDFAQHDGAPAELAQPTGTLSPGSGLVGNRYIIELDAHPPTDLGDSPWAGISGAAVYSGDLLVGVVALDPAHRAHAALKVVPAYVLLADGGFRATVEEHTAPQGLRWEPVELQELMDRQSPLRASTAPATPASLLLARRAVVPFRPGREDLLEQLRQWSDAPGVGAWLLHGRGGQGKTRLAQHFGGQLTAARWTVLWLDPQTPNNRLPVLAQVTTPLLVIIDYAETRITQVQDLFATLAATVGDRPVKILLLARVLGEWWNQIATSSDIAADIIDTAHTTELPPLDQSPRSREETYRAAVTAFAAALPGLAGPTARVQWPRAAERALATPAPEFDSAATALAVQMSALTALLDTTTPTLSSTGPRSLEDRVLDHEHRYWNDTAGGRGLTDSLGLPTLKDAIAATTVLAPATATDLDDVLSRVPELADQPLLTRNKVRAWLMSLYPGPTPDAFAGLAPDRLAEHLIGRLMLDHTRPCIIETLTTTPLTSEQTRQLLTVCTRAATHLALGPAVGHRLTTWCRRHPDTLLVHAIEVATRVETPTPLTDALDQTINDPTTPTDTLASLHNNIPHSTHALAPTAAELARVLTDRYRTSDQPPETNRDLASSLNNLSNRLSELGRHEEGLAAAEEAAGIYRKLAETRPDAYLPDLAMSLNGLAVRLGD
ncbi:P-loop NTPase, partial [Nocardia gipuzkoensis]